MSKHTPGPWQFYTPSEFPDDFRIARQTKVVRGEWNDGYVGRLTRSHGDGPGSQNPRKEDACLIAAAPDLLAACVAIVNAWEADDIGQIDGELIDRASAAIAKAGGAA